MEHNKFKETEFAKLFFEYFLNKTDIFNISKIINVLDFINLHKLIEKNNFLTNQFLHFYSISSNFEKEINFNSNIGAKTKNIIFYIRNLMIEERQIIFDSISTIDLFNENFNEARNTEKIIELSELLIIEKLKIENAQLNDISYICDNIINLRDKLTPFENAKIKFYK